VNFITNLQLTQAFAQVRKAVTAGLAAGVAAFYAAIQDGNLSQSDEAAIVGAVIVSTVLVFLVPNRPVSPAPAK
jgi:hypothetical protein